MIVMVRAKFQSTPLREGRRFAKYPFFVCFGFNPRPSVRGDQELPEFRIPFKSFNPRPSVRGDAMRF